MTLTDGSKQVMMFSNAGKAIRFDESDVRAMGRSAAGVTGMRLQDGQKLYLCLLLIQKKELC